MRRVAVIASASGNGKTTVGRALADALGVPFHELDALHWGPNWAEPGLEEFRARVAPLVSLDAWVVDGSYTGKLGTLVLDAADTVVWLDLPLRVWLPRLVRRTIRRWRRREELWNGNREHLWGAFWGRDALVPYALRSHFRRRREYPAELAGYRVVRLRSQAQVDAFIGVVRGSAARPPTPRRASPARSA